MIWIYASAAVLTAAFAVCVWRGTRNYDAGDTWFLPGLLLGLVALAAIGCSIGFAAGSKYAEGQCHRWSVATGREVKFVRYTPVSWACLTRSSDGRWIPIDQLREFAK